MFKIYLDGEKMFDSRIDDLALENAVLTLEVNNAGDFNFTVSPGHPFYEKIEPVTSTIDIYRDEEWLWQGRVMEPQQTFNQDWNYYAEGALGYFNDSIQRLKYYNDIRPMQYAGILIDNHNASVPENRRIKLGAVTIVDPNDSVTRYTNYNNTLQELKEDLVDDLGGYLVIRNANDGLHLDILKDYGHTNEQIIEFGENLLDLVKDFDYLEMGTCFIPLGASEEGDLNKVGTINPRITIADVNGGSDYIVNRELFDKYGEIWKTVEWSDVHIPSILKTKAENYIKELQFGEMVIEAKAIDLNMTDREFETFHLGDKVRIISKPHGLDRFFNITKLTIDFNNPSNNTITLGGSGTPTMTGAIRNAQVSTGKIREEITEPNTLIEAARKQATEIINSQLLNGHVVIMENEILIMDTDNIETATKVWRWNAGGLGYSNHGYYGPYETAITMDGTISGKFLAANSIAAEKLDVNYRTKVETQIELAEENACDYTDSKLKNYYTIKETEVKFQTTADSILSSVSSTYTTKTEYGKLETRVKSTEQKVTEDGIFTTINSGIKGSKSISTTKFTMDKNGLTIQGGGLTIKNNSGTNVLYADTSGNIVIRGNFYHYNSSGYKAIDIVNNLINVYAWKQNGDWVGAIGSIGPGSNNSAGGSSMGLWCDYYDEIIFGYAPAGFQPGTTNMNYTINSIIRMDRNGISYIKGATSGTITMGPGSITVKNGIITTWDYGSTLANGTYTVGCYSLNYSWGMLTSMTTNTPPLTGSITFGPHSLTFTRGMLTGNSYGTVYNGSMYIGPHTISINKGLITNMSTSTSTLNGTINIGPHSLTFTRGMLTGNTAGTTYNTSFTVGNRTYTFTAGMLTGVR